MKIVRDPVPAALDEVMDQCRRAAAGYRHAAEILEVGVLDDLFESLADERKDLAGELEARIREIGDTPRAEDVEGELLEEAARSVRKVFAADEKPEMIGERLEGEDEILAACAEAADAEGLTGKDKSLIDKVRKSAEAAKEKLSQAER